MIDSAAGFLKKQFRVGSVSDKINDTNTPCPLVWFLTSHSFNHCFCRWTRSWAATYMVSQYDIIVASLDARGSGYRGDGIMHLLYKKIGNSRFRLAADAYLLRFLFSIPNKFS